MSLVVPLRKQVERMRWYQPPPEGRAGRLRLDFNENTAGPAPAVLRALARLKPERISFYPEYLAAESKLAHFFGVRPEQLTVANGIDDALRLIADGFAEADKPLLLVEPTFTMYRFYADLLGARVITLRYDDRLCFPLDNVLRVLRRERPRLFFLANPNNPTGDLLAPRTIRRILEAGQRTMVVVDEAYYEFSGVTVAPWIRRYPNLIVTRTFSKAAGLAGLRLGCLISNAEVIAALRRLRAPFSVNAAALAAGLAVAASPGTMRRYVREVTAARGELERALTRLGVPVYPSAANFLLADFGERGPSLLARLQRRGILLRDRKSDFGRPGWVRITIGTRAQTRLLIRELERLWTPARS
jgi:histidinol-phosphate aminotransferase